VKAPSLTHKYYNRIKKLGRDSRDSLFCCGIIDEERGFLTLAPKIIEFFKGEEERKVFFCISRSFPTNQS